jgi:anthranilate synthase component 1
MYRTSYDTFLEYNGKPDFPLVPIWHERDLTDETPEGTFHRISAGYRYAFLLESMEGDQKTARYSFVGADPFERIVGTKQGINRINDRGVLTLEGNPIELMREIMKEYRTPVLEHLPRFTGGAVGYFGYDVVRHFEDIPDENPDDLAVPDLHFIVAGKIVVFDHARKRMYVIVNMLSNTTDPESAYQQGMTQVDDMLKRIDQPPPSDFLFDEGPSSGCDRAVSSNVTRAAFEDTVRTAKEYIAAGDIFQVVLSQRFSMEIDRDPFDVYRALARLNPSPYLFYLRLDDVHIVGSSPETMVLAENRRVTVRPLAGTCRRGTDETEDRLLIEEMLNDPKERAEHVMLVDLGRNDLGKVCEYGSVELSDLMFVERYSHVMHLVSTLRGRLRPGLDRFDALMACFPAGTVTGAPKVRAMEIIDELEPSLRSVYAGAILYLDFSGNLDSCISIRTLVVKGGKAYVQAGAGIVADSVPEREFQETLNKAKALLKALELAGKGL